MELSDLTAELRKIRKRKKIGQKEVGADIGLTPQSVSGFEHGRVIPTVYQIEDIANSLGCRIECMIVEETDGRIIE